MTADARLRLINTHLTFTTSQTKCVKIDSQKQVATKNDDE